MPRILSNKPMEYSEFKYLVKSDLFRYANGNKLRDHIYHYFISPGYRYTYWLRLCTYLYSRKISRFAFPIAWLVYHRLQLKYGIGISFKQTIGPGLFIGHHGGIFTNERSVIGKNCNLSHEVTIGLSLRGEKRGVPVIGDNVYIGPGAKIFGKVKIGNNAAVGANCVVTGDVPENAVVVGVPGKVISYQGSTGYINHILEK